MQGGFCPRSYGLKRPPKRDLIPLLCQETVDNHSEENTYCTSAGPQQEYWSHPKHRVPGTPHFVTRSPTGWSSLVSCLWNGSSRGGKVQDVGFHVAFQREQRTTRSGGIFQKVPVGARRGSHVQKSQQLGSTLPNRRRRKHQWCSQHPADLGSAVGVRVHEETTQRCTGTKHNHIFGCTSWLWDC